ncbi:hypothetical protein IH992_15330 [Candidatus Poribacteria bacterium]|nr:hypothetical protein [Candidatus Poribacteria bacterium]
MQYAKPNTHHTSRFQATDGWGHEHLRGNIVLRLTLSTCMFLGWFAISVWELSEIMLWSGTWDTLCETSDIYV